MPSLATACERMRYWCDEANLGYDQDQRWNIWYGGECDCSSLVIHVLNEAGFDTGDASYTGNMSEELTARGWKRLPAVISNAKAGDILLNDSHHTCLVIDGEGWDARIGQASIDENGRARGGQSGDQSGRETNTGDIYEYWAGWDCILRYGEPIDDEPAKEEVETMQFVYNGGGDVYRLYDGNMHLFTPFESERDDRIADGWNYEGVAWKAQKSAEIPVYRMYNPNNGDHFLTQDFATCTELQSKGWIPEGVPFFTNRDGMPVFRLYNPNTGEHFYTVSEKERDDIRGDGWDYEGIAFNAE